MLVLSGSGSGSGSGPEFRCLTAFAAQTEAFRDPCYKWLWIQGFIGQIGGIISGQFTFFWSVKLSAQLYRRDLTLSE